MFASKDGFVALVGYFHEFVHDGVARLLVFTLFLDGYAHSNGVADEHRLDESHAVVAVREGLGIDRARRQAHRHAEDERAMRNALLEFLRLAPFGVQVVRITVTGLARVQDDVRLGDGAAECLAGRAHRVVFEELGCDHVN